MVAFEFLSKEHALIGTCLVHQSVPSAPLQLLVFNILQNSSEEQRSWSCLKGYILDLPTLNSGGAFRGMHIQNDPLTSYNSLNQLETPFFQTPMDRGSILQVQVQASSNCVFVILLSAFKPFTDLPEDVDTNPTIGWSAWGEEHAHLLMCYNSWSLANQDYHSHGAKLVDYVESGTLYLYDFNPVKHALPTVHQTEEEERKFHPYHLCHSQGGSLFTQTVDASLPCTVRQLPLPELMLDIGSWPMVFCSDDCVGFVSPNFA
jgi:hypothetical protein